MGVHIIPITLFVLMANRRLCLNATLWKFMAHKGKAQRILTSSASDMNRQLHVLLFYT